MKETLFPPQMTADTNAVMTSGFTGSGFKPFGNLAGGERRLSGGEGRVHGGSLIALLAAGRSGGSSDAGKVQKWI